MPDRDSLAIIIVTYNSAHEIDACLDSLVGHTAPFPTTITVVDNKSSDGTAEHVRQRWPMVQVIDSGGNLGFARANNIGIKATSSDYVLLMNPDTVSPPGAIQTLVRGLASHPEAAIAGARLLSERGFPELSWGIPITPWNELKTMIFSRLYLRKNRRIVRKMDKLSRVAREVDWVSGACMVIRRADLEEAGLLDERYFMYNEDVDLCLAMKKRDRTVLYIAGAEVLHYRGKSAARNPELERLRQQSHVAYYEKHLPRWTPLLRLYLKVTVKL
ncbi:MAG: glycosyltransferase family 2 protein [Cyanobacteria bacterium]|nr:glycosyltransferase family 2 protein [Cyanobacteriota bacterium]